MTSTIIESSWDTWLNTFGPNTFTTEFAGFHRDFWTWYWRITEKRRKGELLRDEELAFLAIWPRGSGKSVCAEWAAIAEGALVQEGYVLYCCANESRAIEHVSNIRERLESEEVARFYPHLAQPKIGRFGNRYGWSQDVLVTAGGWSIRPVGLETGIRGGRRGDLRPTLIILDDVDDISDSTLMIEKKLRTIARSIIPAGGPQTVILFPQNLIHRESVLNRILTRKSDILSRRVVSGPFPAFEGIEIESQGGRSIITGGRPTWAGIDLEACQDFLEKAGRDAFLAEYQHDINRPLESAVFPEWSELHHVITWSEFVRCFGKIACGCAYPHDLAQPCPNPRIPFTWNLGRGLDWGCTQNHPCAVVWCARPAERDKLNDCVFVYRELVRPHFPPLLGQEPYLVNPRRIAEAILAAEHRWEETAPYRMKMSIMSHEASATHNTFLDPDEPQYRRLGFMKHRPVPQAGIPQIQNYLEIDQDQLHPFRVNGEGQRLAGRPRLYLIVPDDQGDLYKENGQWKVRPPIDERGLARLRYEFPRYRYTATAEGNEKEKPVAYEEDALCALRYLANVFFPRRAPKSYQERVEEHLPLTLREDFLRNLPWEEWQGIASRRAEAIREAEREMRLTARKGRLYDESQLRGSKNFD